MNKFIKTTSGLSILHIEMPRALTATARMPDLRSAARLEKVGIDLHSVDIGSHFWSFIMGRANLAGLNIWALGDCSSGIESLFAANDVLRSLNADGIPLTPFGFAFDDGEFQSTEKLKDIVSEPAVNDLIGKYAESVFATDTWRRASSDILSIGVDSAQSLAFACVFSCHVRRCFPKMRLVLGRHGYENFSLSLRADDVRNNANLERYFDHVIYTEEKFADELAMVAGSEAGAAELPDVEWLSKKVRESFPAEMSFSPGQTVVMMPLSRNRCYWKRCTFCVQIARHVSDRYFPEREEMDWAISELAALSINGFRSIIFSDEAVTPSNLRRLCKALGQADYGLDWTVRIIADTEVDPTLIRLMADSGCVEVLFGLETVDAKTAVAMGKVSADSGEEELYAMLRNFSDARIGIFLNVIAGFPTESDDGFEKTYQFAKHVHTTLPGVTVQYNRFALFHGTTIFQEPDKFGVKVFPPTTNNDLQITCDYEDSFGRSETTPVKTDVFAAGLGLDEDAYERLAEHYGEDVIFLAFQLNYASFGLLHKKNRKTELLPIIIEHLEAGLV